MYPRQPSTLTRDNHTSRYRSLLPPSIYYNSKPAVTVSGTVKSVTPNLFVLFDLGPYRPLKGYLSQKFSLQHFLIKAQVLLRQIQEGDECESDSDDTGDLLA